MSPRPTKSRPGFKVWDGAGRMSPNRVAWLRCVIGQFVIMKNPNDEEPEEGEKKLEIGASYRLLLPRPGGRPISYDITALTHEEFVALKQLFNHLFDLAEPVILERDRIAEDAFAQGDDSFARSYRQVPQLVIREGADGENRQGVQQRPDDLPSGDESDSGGVEDLRGSSGGVRGAGDELAAGEPQAAEPQDDEPQAD